MQRFRFDAAFPVPVVTHMFSPLRLSFSQWQRMGQAKSKSPTTSSSNDTILPKILPRAPQEIKFRILIVGRANAGKTTILQRISSSSSCDFTKSPDSEVFRLGPRGDRERVRPHSQWHIQTHYLARLNSNLQWRSGRFSLIGDC